MEREYYGIAAQMRMQSWDVDVDREGSCGMELVISERDRCIALAPFDGKL